MLGVCREKLRVLGSLCGHTHSGDREDPIGVPAGAEGGFARVCVCVCTHECECGCFLKAFRALSEKVFRNDP